MTRARAVLVAFIFMLLVLPIVGGAPGSQPAGPPFVPGEVLLKFKSTAQLADHLRLRADLGATTLHTFLSGAEHWKLAPNADVAKVVARLKLDPSVLYAEPNYVVKAHVVPNDPRLAEEWGLINTGQSGGTADADIDAELAWNVSTGSNDVIVADIDTGLDYNHPDIAANVWTNPGEIPGNGIDDDGNGFVDDVHGWDFYNNDNDPFDDNGHGTHTAGTIGAVGDNGIGVAGVNWHVKIMPCKFLSSGGSGSTAGAVSCVDYTTMMGAAMSNNSWGGGGYSQTLYDAIANANAHNVAFVAAAGNSSADTDASPNYPSCYDLPNIIAVAATDRNDALASFSNWGLTTVDLAAPGVDVLSTLPGNSYGLLSGTSMATPHVTGTLALIKAVNPNIPVGQMKSVLLGAVDHIPSMNGKCVTGGRLNAFRSIATPDTTPPGMINDIATTDAGSNTMGLTWTATGDDGAVGTATYYEVRYSTSPIDTSNWAAATRVGNEPAPQLSGGAEAMEVRNLASSTTYFFAVKAFDEWGNAGPISNLATGHTLPSPTGEVSPTSVSADLYTGQEADRSVMLTNVGVGTLDFSIPPPALAEPSAANPFLDLGKDDPDPRHGDPSTAGTGGPDTFGYRWSDSDQAGGPVFQWTDISSTGTAVVTGDDSTSSPVALGFNMPLYGTLFDSIRVCTNGWLSFTSTSTAYANQPLPNSGAPENLVAPFWDDLNVTTGGQVFFQSFGTKAIVQWDNVVHYTSSGTGTYTFQAILDSGGSVTFQYLSMVGTLDSATIGIQDPTKSVGLQVAFNQAYVHDNMAVRIASIPQWLTANPTSGRLGPGASKTINLHMNASGLEGGTYPGTVNILTNDPAHPVLAVGASLHVIGAPEAQVQPDALDFGTVFLGQPYHQTLIVANTGTDTLHVSAVAPSDATLSASPASFAIPPHGSQNVVVTWTPAILGPFSGSVTVTSDAVSHPTIVVPVSGASVPTPVMIYDPTFFDETLFSGNSVTRTLRVTNTGGPDLIVDAAADLGGSLVYADDVGANGAGGPDAFGYRWKDSDASGGPTYNFIDISSSGTQILGTQQDDSLSAVVPMGMTFPFYGSNFTSFRASANGWISFTSAIGSGSGSYSNQSLPTGGTTYPENLLALFWDDLHTRAAGNVKWLYDGTRVIIQYTNVQLYSSSTSNLTMQVQLYPNGKILYMYKTMTGAFTSGTIGIQNGTRTVGLTANYNAAYVHGSMAIQISRTPDWLAITPSHAVIPPNQYHDFNVTFDSTERLGGTLNGAVVLNTNVPSQAQARVPAALHVIGAPIAAIVPTSYAYGSRFTGYSYPVSFQVLNNGTDVLNVSGVTSDDPTLVIEDSSSDGAEFVPEATFPLPPGGARLFTMRWTPTSPAALNTRIHVLSDDPVSPDRTMPVTGTAIRPPVAAWSPASMSQSLTIPAAAHQTLRLQNQGGSDLNWTSLISLNSGATVSVDHSPELKKDEPDTRPGILGAGGPDVFGYRWRDSDQAGGPVFSWYDIGSIGTTINFASQDDSNFQGIPIGFAFPFYGQSFTSVNACTNGFLSFTDTATSLTNYSLPSTSGPANLLAVFWDDLHQRNGTAKYYGDGTKFIVQYTNWDQYSPSGELYTFQVILYPSGRIVYQYLSMTTNDLAGATVGIQNANRDDGLTVDFNAQYVHNGMAVEFRPPSAWLSVSPEAGTIPAGGSADLDVLFDSNGMIGGDYAAFLDFTTNDPAHASIRVPASMHLTGIPDIQAAPASLTFPMTYLGFNRMLTFDIRNNGTDVLQITSLTVNGDFFQDGVSLDPLAPGQSMPVTVTFQPTAPGARTGEIILGSNDPDTPLLTVPLGGQALAPPELHVAPASLSAFLPPASTATRMLQVCNTGGSDLHWASKANIVSGASVTQHGGVEIPKDAPDTNPGIFGTGGPDLFGYRWTDSDQPGGPAFDWIDIAGIGTPVGLNGDDQNVQGIPIGFDFKFYGNTFNTLNASSNGWLSFTNTTSALTNYALPSTSAPENLLAAFWDDLDMRPASGSGRAYYWSDGTQFVLSYITVPRYSSGGPYTFQVILNRNGSIKFQYLTLAGTRLNEATIGIQNGAKNDGLTVVYNENFVHDSMAVEFKAIPQWAMLSPESGVVAAGTCQDVNVMLDSTGLDHGVHDSLLHVQAEDDPYLAYENVPLTLTVNNKPLAVSGTPQTVECTGNNAALTMLHGGGSSDPDHDPITYLWSAPGITFDDPTSATPSASFPLGNTTVTLVVNDGYENSDPATVTVGVVDTTPPVISVAATPNYLWPPNHKMSTVNTTVLAVDVCDPSPMIALTSAVSNEPDDAQGGGDGQTTDDVQDASLGTADFQLLLRAERDGKGPGRTYTLTYQAMDHSGNASLSGAAVQVPHDLGSVVEPLDLVLSDARHTRVSWGAVAGAVHYDVIRGDVANLRIEGSNVDLGPVVCIERDSVDTSTQGNEDSVTPAPGQAFFYAVQFYDGLEESSYGSESVGRARVLPQGSGNCP